MTLFLTGLLAGLLDITAAMLLFLSRGNKDPRILLRYIASAVYGKDAFVRGNSMVLMGLLFHFAIAMIWVAIYFILHAYIPWLDSHRLLAAIGYGLVVWIIMNLVILPNSRATPRPFSWPFALINMAILIGAIGLPVAYFSS